MGNSSSSSAASACCISFDEISLSDENTLQTKSTFNAQKNTSVKRKALWNTFTSEEREKIKSSMNIPDATDIQEGYSLSSISSKSSSSKQQDSNKDDYRQITKLLGMDGSCKDPHAYHNMDEMRNDAAECCNSTRDEIRAIASSYDESGEDALMSYYQAGSGINRRISRLRGDNDTRE